MADINWKSYYGDNPDTSDFYNPSNGREYDDVMKFSNCTNVVVEDKRVAAGRENCVDAVRGSNYLWKACEFFPFAGKSTFTIKGAIDGWQIENSEIGRGQKTDIELGQFDNYWSPGRPPTRNGRIIRCFSNDGQPIRVTCWNADAPQVFESNVKITRVPWIVWFPYFCFQYIAIRIGKR